MSGQPRDPMVPDTPQQVPQAARLALSLQQAETPPPTTTTLSHEITTAPAFSEESSGEVQCRTDELGTSRTDDASHSNASGDLLLEISPTSNKENKASPLLVPHLEELIGAPVTITADAKDMQEKDDEGFPLGSTTRHIPNARGTGLVSDVHFAESQVAELGSQADSISKADTSRPFDTDDEEDVSDEDADDPEEHTSLISRCFNYWKGRKYALIRDLFAAILGTLAWWQFTLVSNDSGALARFLAFFAVVLIGPDVAGTMVYAFLHATEKYAVFRKEANNTSIRIVYYCIGVKSRLRKLVTVGFIWMPGFFLLFGSLRKEPKWAQILDISESILWTLTLLLSLLVLSTLVTRYIGNQYQSKAFFEKTQESLFQEQVLWRLAPKTKVNHVQGTYVTVKDSVGDPLAFQKMSKYVREAKLRANFVSTLSNLRKVDEVTDIAAVRLFASAAYLNCVNIQQGLNRGETLPLKPVQKLGGEPKQNDRKGKNETGSKESGFGMIRKSSLTFQPQGTKEKVLVETDDGLVDFETVERPRSNSFTEGFSLDHLSEIQPSQTESANNSVTSLQSYIGSQISDDRNPANGEDSDISTTVSRGISDIGSLSATDFRNGGRVAKQSAPSKSKIVAGPHLRKVAHVFRLKDSVKNNSNGSVQRGLAKRILSSDQRNADSSVPGLAKSFRLIGRRSRKKTASKNSIPRTDYKSQIIQKDTLIALLKYREKVTGVKLDSERAWRVIDPNNTGAFNYRMLRAAVRDMFKSRRDLAKSLQDASSVVQKLGYILDGLFFFFGGVIITLFFGIDLQATWLTVSSTVVGFAFVFGGFLKRIFENLVFVFSERRFDVGDLLLLEGTYYYVEQVDLQATTCRRWDGLHCVFQHSYFRGLTPLINCNRGSNHWQYHTLIVDIACCGVELKNYLVKGLHAFTKNHPEAYSGTIQVALRNLHSPLKVEIKIYVEFAYNLQDLTTFMDDNSFLLEETIKLLHARGDVSFTNVLTSSVVT